MINLLRHFRASCPRRRHPRAATGRGASLSQLATRDSQLPPRRGISLLEVLISMFVLLFGLMGVAAIFPVGNHYAGKSEQFDRGSALAEAAFADLKARGMLKPELWLYADPNSGGPPTTDFIIQTPSASPKKTVGYFNSPFFSPLAPPDQDYKNGTGFAFVIDPLGAAAAIQDGIADFDVFPFADLSPTKLIPTDPTAPASAPWRWAIRRITLPIPGTLDSPSRTRMRLSVAETIFRLHDDVTNELPPENDRPGIQRWTAVDATGGTPNNTPKDPSDDTLLARSYTGNYTWLATVVPTSTDSLLALQPINSRFGSDLYEVSVAVFNKREILPSAESERAFQAAINLGGELVLYSTNDQTGSDAIDAATEDIRAGQWIAVAGVHPTSGQFLLKWYRLLSMDDETAMDQVISPTVTGTYAVRRLMLDGPDWPMGGNATVQDLRAILLPGVISVATQMLPMEAQ